MAVQVISFESYGLKSIHNVPVNLIRESIYSQVYEELRRTYKNGFMDGNGTVFVGANGERAVLTDNSLKSNIHELVLVNVPLEVASGLLKLIDKKD